MCQRIRLAQLEVDMLIIEARKRYWNKTSSTKLDVQHEQLRHLWRLFFERFLLLSPWIAIVAWPFALGKITPVFERFVRWVKTGK